MLSQLQQIQDQSAFLHPVKMSQLMHPVGYQLERNGTIKNIQPQVPIP